MNTNYLKQRYVYSDIYDFLNINFKEIDEVYKEILSKYPISYIQINKESPFKGNFLIIHKNQISQNIFIITDYIFSAHIPLFEYNCYYVYKCKAIKYLTNNCYNLIF